MTPEQEHDIDNALLTIMYEWKIGAINQRQALREFKQCLKYYSRMEDVIQFEENKLVDERIIEHYGMEKVIERCKNELAENIAKAAIARGCVSFEVIERDRHQALASYRHFRMKMEAIVQVTQQPSSIPSPATAPPHS